MKTVNAVLTYAAIILLIFSFIVLDGGLRSGNLQFIIAGGSVIVLASIIYWILYFREKRKEKRNQTKREAELNRFKQEARQIVVYLDKVKIKSHSWTEEIVVRESKYSGVDTLFGNYHHNVEKVKNELNTVEFEIPTSNGKNIKYKTRIDMNKESLQIHFAIQKSTIFYVKDDDHYLDLEFLRV